MCRDRMFLGQGRNLESTQVHTFASPLEYHVALRIYKALLRWSVKAAEHGTLTHLPAFLNTT